MSIVVVVMYFVVRVMLSILINNFVLYVAVVERVVLIAVKALYKPPLLLSSKIVPSED